LAKKLAQKTDLSYNGYTQTDEATPMITSSYLKRPVVMMKVRAAVVEATKTALDTDGHGRAYITDYEDNNIMRLDVFTPNKHDLFPQGGVIVYGEGSCQITTMVEEAIGQPFSEMLSFSN
jgi:hypothetical protein